MKRAYRSTEFNDERKWKSKSSLDDVLQVGTHKAVGYICQIEDHEDHNEQAILKLQSQLLANGKLTIYEQDFDPDHEWCPSLWAGDEKMIQSILDRNRDLVITSGWPAQAASFFDRLVRDDVSHKNNRDMYHLICELFNSWCLHCEKTIWVKGRSAPLSEHPFDPDIE